MKCEYLIILWGLAFKVDWFNIPYDFSAHKPGQEGEICMRYGFDIEIIHLALLPVVGFLQKGTNCSFVLFAFLPDAKPPLIPFLLRTNC